ncbi:hypothetical protein HU200_041630 [Digitaria exilis]|uniref:F-box domain-containing protein n=1 Tax=Digitaria exilis TaxID=1010633 RepID=A0A835BF90_9POAL|nr:hypothetical protein HU200_041630 [Digitaria exilis]
MEASSGTCEIAQLPEEILSALLALTTPRDACRAAAACRDFRGAADSDAVWSRFMPRGELSGSPASSGKGRFLRLCDRPVLLADGLTSMWLDREGGAKCYMLSARQLNIAWGDTPHYWSWIPIQGSRGGRDGIPQNVLLPRERADGWMEVEMGEFQNDEGEDGEVSIKLMETSATVKSGLIVQGIEIRPKKLLSL